MHDTEFNREQTVKFLVWTFAIAYILQIAAAYLYNNVNIFAGQALVMLVMLVPALGVLLSGAGLKDMGWKPQIRKNIKWILTAWFTPAILTIAGAALYFMVFPGHFDLSGGFIVQSAGPQALEQMEAQGLTYPLYVLVSLAGIVTYAPLINMFPALGEEIGWRGFLYPQLQARFGRKKGWILGGIIWGAWHWPLIWLIGYEYGFGYVGFPVLGMLLFCLFTVALGIWCDRLYERSGSIWLPALLHGAINAAAGLPLTVCLPDTGSFRLLGPAPNGLIAGLPMLILAAVCLLREVRQSPQEKA